MRTYVLFVLTVLMPITRAGAQDAPGSPSSSQAQGSTASTAAIGSANLATGTAFLAKLSTDLTASTCKPGDLLEAEAKQDVKNGKQVVLKKGSKLVGRVTAVQLATAEKPENKVGISFDTVRMSKTGQQFSLHLIIQALAPQADITNHSTLADGRGMDAAANNAAVSGHASTLRGSVNELTAASTGIFDLVGIRLGEEVSGTTHTTILASSAGYFHLKKGMQLVLRVVEP